MPVITLSGTAAFETIGPGPNYGGIVDTRSIGLAAWQVQAVSGHFTVAPDFSAANFARASINADVGYTMGLADIHPNGVVEQYVPTEPFGIVTIGFTLNELFGPDTAPYVGAYEWVWSITLRTATPETLGGWSLGT